MNLMPTALCILSKQPFIDLFDQIMDHVVTRWLCCPEAIFPLLDAILLHPTPGMGDVFHVRIRSQINNGIFFFLYLYFMIYSP